MSSDVKLVRNEATGRFDLSWDSTGDVEFTDNESHAVLVCLIEWRAKWWADRDGTHGSQLYKVRSLTKGTSSQVEAYAREALQGLVDANRITITNLVAKSDKNNGRLWLTVDWTTPTGATGHLYLPM